MVDVGGLNGEERSPFVFEEKQIRRKNVAWLSSLTRLHLRRETGSILLDAKKNQ